MRLFGPHLLWMTALLAGCTVEPADDDGPPPPICDMVVEPSTPRSLEMGRFDDNGNLVHLTPERPLPAEFGLQGGYHVTVGVRLFTDVGDRARHRFVLDSVDGIRLGASRVESQICAPGWNSLTTLVFLNTATTSSGALELTTTLLELDTPVATLTATAAVRVIELD